MTFVSKPWETLLLDWDAAAGVDGTPISPEVVLDLLSATSDTAATLAYWKLDGLVCANGITYTAALPATRMILSTLPMCPLPARRRSLELLGQIATGESHVGSPDIVQQCVAELRYAAWYLLHGLQFDRAELVWLYVDLIGVLGEEFPAFRERAQTYLERVLTRDLSTSDREVVQNTVAALRQNG